MGRTLQAKKFGGLNFRKISLFNKVLVAKQVWRMVCNPHSLVARVFKARYFQSGNIMEAEVSSNPSIFGDLYVGVENYSTQVYVGELLMESLSFCFRMPGFQDYTLVALPLGLPHARWFLDLLRTQILGMRS